MANKKHTSEGSAPLNVNKADWKKVGKGSLIALSGAAITILIDVIPQVDLGKWTPVVAAVSAVVVNFLRIWIADSTQ